MNKIFLSAFAGFIFLLSRASFATDQNAKLWLGVNYNLPPKPASVWRSYLYAQLRLIDKTPVLQTTLMEGAVGYLTTAQHSFWLGYRWSGHNPDAGFSEENRLFQQSIFQNKTPSYHLILRSRLEEMTRSDDHQLALRFRERFAIEIEHRLFKNAVPFFYDEIFFQLNHPNYMPHTFIGQNRLFLGFNLYSAKTTWWEIGYINQYQTHTPTQSQNEMGHIISVTYNFS